MKINIKINIILYKCYTFVYAYKLLCVSYKEKLNLKKKKKIEGGVCLSKKQRQPLALMTTADCHAFVQSVESTAFREGACNAVNEWVHTHRSRALGDTELR